MARSAAATPVQLQLVLNLPIGSRTWHITRFLLKLEPTAFVPVLLSAVMGILGAAGFAMRQYEGITDGSSALTLGEITHEMKRRDEGPQCTIPALEEGAELQTSVRVNTFATFALDPRGDLYLDLS